MSHPQANHVQARGVLPGVLFMIAAVVALGAYFKFVSGAPLTIDTAWRDVVQLTRQSFAFPLAAFLAEFGTSLGVAACAAIVAALLFAMRHRREALAIITALALGVALSEAMKFLVGRPRPLDAIYAFTETSYPSGHSMGAAALAVSFALAVSSISRRVGARLSRTAVRWVWIAAIAWTILMMWSRTALGVHWLSDVIAGALLGLSTALIAHRVWCRRVGVDSQA